MSDEKLIDSDMPICRVDGCDARSTYRLKRLCKKHYRRLREYGTTDLPTRSLEERLYGRIMIASSGCWVWRGALSTKGYGRLFYDGRDDYAHRLSWQLANGEIPKDLVVRHSCDNPPCVNPDHLLVGTPADNTRDMMIRGRHWTGARWST